MELKFSKFGKDFTVADVHALPEASRSYLYNYGFQQSMQDCIAGLAKAVGTEYAEECSGLGITPDNAELQRRTEAAIEGMLGKRLDAIVEGTVGVRAPQADRDPLAKIAREEIWVELRKVENKAKLAKVRAMSKEDRQAKLAELTSAHVAKNRDRLQAEWARRNGAVAEVKVEIEL